MAKTEAAVAESTQVTPEEQTGVSPIADKSVVRTEDSATVRPLYEAAQGPNSNDEWKAMTGNGQTDVQKALSTVANGIWTWDSSEKIFSTLSDIKDKGKMGELVQSFDSTYSMSLSNHLKARFPFQHDRINDLLGGKSATTVANEIWTWDSSEKVFNKLNEIKDQGKMDELVQSFDRTYNVSLSNHLKARFPFRHDRINELLDNKPATFDGMSESQLKVVLNKFPELKGVIDDPKVLGAMVQNEVDHTYGVSDHVFDLVAKGIIKFNRTFGEGDGTEFFAKVDVAALKAKVKNSGLFENLPEKALLRMMRISIGDGQVQLQNITGLRKQEQAAGREELPSLSMSQTPIGSAQLVAAMLTRSVHQLSSGQIGRDANRSSGMSVSQRAGLLEAQRLWNLGDQKSRERAVMMTYNPGAMNSMDGKYWGPERILKHYLNR